MKRGRASTRTPLRRLLAVAAAALVAATTLVITASGVATATTPSPSLDCLNPASVWGTNASGNLLWYGNADPAGGSWSYAAGTGNAVGSGWTSGINYTFSGGDGVIYTVDADGTLHWYRHLGDTNGSASWAAGSGKQVGGPGWNSFARVFSGGGGVLYAVDYSGNLYWYKHLGALDGANAWAANAGKLIGHGFGERSFSGGDGIIYSIDANTGDLHWYRHLDPQNGAAVWANGGTPRTIGWGWNTGIAGYPMSLGGGVILVVRSDGTLEWYRENNPYTGGSTWSGPKAIGTGWQNLISPMADVHACGSAASTALAESYGDSQCAPYSTALGRSSCEEWCADFLDWVWQHAGLRIDGLTAGVPSVVSWGENNGTWHAVGSGYHPQVGDAVVFASQRYSDGAHVGMVINVGTNGYITERGGNQGGVTTWGPFNPQGDLSSFDPGQWVLGYTSPLPVNS